MLEYPYKSFNNASRSCSVSNPWFNQAVVSLWGNICISAKYEFDRLCEHKLLEITVGKFPPYLELSKPMLLPFSFGKCEKWLFFWKIFAFSTVVGFVFSFLLLPDILERFLRLK